MNFLTRLAAAAAFSALSISSQAASLVATDATFGAFDQSRGTRTLTIAGSGIVNHVSIAIDFAKCDNDAMQPNQRTCAATGEEFAAETFFYLLSPTGSRVDLVWTYSSRPEGSEGGSTKADGTYTNGASVGGRYFVTFDDLAASAVGPVMQDGIFRPEEMLSAFNGLQAQGNWVLGMGDSVGADFLSYFSARLVVDTNNVPEPASLALAGLALLGLGAARRRVR